MADTPQSNSPVANAVAAVAGAPAEAPQTAVPPTEADKAFALKERQLHAQRKALMAEKAELQKKIAEYETGYIPRNRLKEDPYGALEESGVDYELLTQQLMNAPQDPASKAMLAHIKKLEAKINETQTAAQQAQERQYNEAVKQITNEAKMLIDSDERFETIKAKGMHEAVVELIKETFESEGYLMDTDEAAQKIEDYLVEEGLSFASLKKVQAKMAPKAAEVPAPAQQKQTGPITTLTNRLDAEVPRKGSSDKERRARALAAFKGELK